MRYWFSPVAMIAAVWSGLWWPLAALAVLAVALPRGRGWCLLLALSWAHGLLALEQAARGSGNLMPPILDAVRAYATLGEVMGVLRQVFGEYQPSWSV